MSIISNSGYNYYQNYNGYSKIPQYNQNLSFGGVQNQAQPQEKSTGLSTAAKLMIGATALAGLVAWCIISRGKGANSNAVSQTTQEIAEAVTSARKSAKSAVEEGLQILRNDDFAKPFKEVGDEAKKFMQDTTSKVDDTLQKLEAREMFFDGSDLTLSELQQAKMNKILDETGYVQFSDDSGRALRKMFADKHIEYYNPETGEIIAKIGSDTKEIIENGRIYRLQNKFGEEIVEVLSSGNNTVIQKAEKVVSSSNVSEILPNNAIAQQADDWNNAQIGRIKFYLHNDDNGNLIKRYNSMGGLSFADGTKMDGYTLSGERVNYKNKIIGNPLEFVDKNGKTILYQDGNGHITRGSNYAFFKLNDKNEIELTCGTWDGRYFQNKAD